MCEFLGSHIPEGWQIKRFGAMVRVGNGQVIPTTAPYSQWQYVGAENIESNSGRLTGLRSAAQLGLISGKYVFDENAIVYSKIRPNLNKVCVPGFKGLCSADAYPLWVKDQDVDRDFLVQFMRSSQFVRQAVTVSMRTGMPKINRPDLNRLFVPIPPKQEQRAIALALSKWDDAHDQLSRLIKLKRRLKRGLMQHLLTGRRRFSEFAGEPWRDVQIEDVLKVVNRTCKLDPHTPYRLVSIRRRSGGFFEREVRLGNLIGYSTLEKIHAGDFVIARRQVVHGAMATVPKMFHGAYVSNAYAILEAHDPKQFHVPFFNYVSQLPQLYYTTYRCSYGVALEKLFFRLDWFLKEPIRIPHHWLNSRKSPRSSPPLTARSHCSNSGWLHCENRKKA